MFRVSMLEQAEKFLRKLEPHDQKRISKKIMQLRRNPQLGKPLTGKLAGYWSLRIGKYRAIYQLIDNELLVLVLKIDKRARIY